jgi:type IV secretion system protein VirD4
MFKFKLLLLAAFCGLCVYIYAIIEMPEVNITNIFTDLGTALFVGLALIAAFFGYRYWAIHHGKSYKLQMKALGKLKKNADDAHGSADFAYSKDLKKLGVKRKDGLILGKFEEKFVRFKQPGHLITFAPTRSGKGVGHVIPNLLDHPGSVIVNDIKGENFAVTGRYRKEFSKVVTFAPFDENSSCYNPLDFIRLGTTDEIDDASLIADMIIVDDNSNDPFWNREAKNIITGLILYVANESPPALRNLGEVRYLIMQAKKDFEFTIRDMYKSKNAFVKKVASSVGATEPKVLASVLSTAKSQTAVWDSPRLTAITSRSEFQLEDLKNEVLSLYVIIPPEYLDVYKPIIRLIVGLATVAMTRIKKVPKDPVLFIIDEFPALGHMKPIESGIGYLAGYGVSLWMFIQDLNQIKDIYERWGTFLSNCSVRMAFGTNDVETAKVLSEMLGTTTIRVEGEGTSSDAGFKLLGSKNSTSTNVSETARPLMTPDEVMRMPFDAQLIFVQGGKPIVAEKVFYFSDPFFKGKFDSWDG